MSPLGAEAFEQFYALYQAEIQQANGALASTQTDFRTSSNAMQSRYDTFREEAEALVYGQVLSLADRMKTLKALQRIKEEGTFVEDRVRIGALVTLVSEAEEETKKRYYVIPGGSGRKITVDSRDFTCVSPDSPIAAEMIGKEVGDEVALVVQAIRKVFEIRNIE